MNWHKGDRAVILNSIFPERVGMVVTIVSELKKKPSWSRPCHEVSLPSIVVPNNPAAYWPKHLGPIPDDKSTWSELEKTLKWNPTKLVTVEIEQ